MEITLELAKYWQNLHLNEGLSLGMIGKTVNENYVNPEQIVRRTFQKYGLFYNKCYRKGKSSTDVNFFKVIDNELKAYLLGYIFADGCVYKNSLQIASIDLELLELVKASICPEQTIYTCKAKRNKYGTDFQSQKYKIHIHNLHLINSLKSFGVVENKTYKNMLFPELREDLVLHFIRGFFDGDGSINTHHLKTHKYENVNLKFSNTSLNVLQKIESVFPFCKFSYEIKPSSTEGINIYYMTTKSTKNIKLIAELMYNNANYFLNRKYNKFIDIFNKRGELLETPTAVGRDNQQPSLSSNTLEGSTTNTRFQSDNAEESNGNTSALPIDYSQNGIWENL